MKRYELEAVGAIENLQCRERDVPAPGAGEVLVRVRANSLNARDLSIILGTYPLTPKPGTVPLSDGAGEVSAIGAGVTRFKVGDRVAGIFHQGWIAGPRTPELPRADLGGSVDGMLADYVVLAQDGLVAIPANLSFAEAATLPCAAVTAWNALTAHGPLLPGSSVLVQGTGGVAMFAAQFARLAGARVIGLSSSAAKIERLKALGVDTVVNYIDHPDWDKQVLAATGKRGVDLVVDVVGQLDKTFRCTRLGGQICMIGRLGNRDSAVAIAPIQQRTLRVIGIGVGSRTDFENMNRAIALHDVHPVIDRCLPFAEAKAAYQAFAARQFIGKIVITND